MQSLNAAALKEDGMTFVAGDLNLSQQMIINDVKSIDIQDVNPDGSLSVKITRSFVMGGAGKKSRD